MRSQYYYFITGLPALSIDDSKSSITLQNFMEEAKTHLTAGDFKLLLLLCLPEDVGDLLRLIYQNESESRPIGECSRAFWQAYIELMKQKAADPSIRLSKDYQAYPDYWHELILGIFSGEELPPFLDSQHRLLEATFAFAAGLRNKFLSGWFEFNREIQNILIAINGRHHKLDFAKHLVGGGELVEKLAKSHAADFGLGKDHELFNDLLRIWEQNNILYRERGYDILRWKWIDNHNFFNYFNIDRILGYYAQLRILSRWLALDPSLGKEVFQDTMDTLSGSFSFPEQFNIKAKKK
ncbi:MAG: DUF2764 domain-containing protein [Candidatus Syntrophosphaera sp.]|nr:DUF2764 domain-containing protein [Candidatus Syntrophosphaera sp.]